MKMIDTSLQQASASAQNLVDQIAEEFIERLRRGERPPIGEYEVRYPQQAAAIRELFPTLVMMEQLKPDSVPVRPASQTECASEVASLGKLGDYRIVREVGRGGMGIVYEAVQESLGRQVALKVLPKQRGVEDSRQARFEREARAAARLHHTNIVPVFGVGAESGLHYYAMQYIHGLGLDEVLRELQRLKSLSQTSATLPGTFQPPTAKASREAVAVTVTQALFTGDFEAGGAPDSPLPAEQAPAIPHQPPGHSLSDTARARLSETVHMSDALRLPGSSTTTAGGGRQTFWQSVARIGVQVGEALHYAHEQGVLHRDIKPSNLLKFFDFVSQGKDQLTAEDFTGTLLTGYGGGFRPGDGPDTAMLIRGLFAGEIGSMYEGPKVGQRAPLFQLRRAQAEGEMELSSLLGEKPLVLVFGNFTCGPFRGYYPAVDALHKKYEGKANFLMVYVREAHPTDGWKMESNTRAGVAVAQPKSFEERAGVAEQFCTRLKPSMPVVIDEVSDAVGHAYSGMPARLYLIDTQGKVAYKSGRGPFGFKPPELEQALVMALLETPPAPATPKPETTGMALPSDEEAWKILPKTAAGAGGPLPNWAKGVALQLPRTAAAMLRLDYAQRTKSPLHPKLRAKMRWVIADANRCEYSKQTALFDLKRAGGNDQEIAVLTGDSTAWPDADKAPLRFAREHSVNAPQIEDALFEQLRKQFGDKQAAAMVLLGAYGNFQDRIVLGLGLPLETSGPLPPLEVEFDAAAFQSWPILPPNRTVPELRADGKDVVDGDADWASISYDELQARIKKQQARNQRLPTPTWEEVAKNIPPEFNARPTRIVWNLVCTGYVPELALPWSTTTRTMWAEAQQDRVLEESLFWVQTRAVQCNYCMGHCEMLLEVAGLTKPQIADRIRKLASDDWSAFPENEQRTYAYARKLSKTPWELTAADYQQLEKDLGKKEAMATFFWLCRGLYMTRVSDGFQLALEQDNVFADFATQTKEQPKDK